MFVQSEKQIVCPLMHFFCMEKMHQWRFLTVSKQDGVKNVLHISRTSIVILLASKLIAQVI